MRRIFKSTAIALALTMAAACSDGPATDQVQPAYGPSAPIVQLVGRVTDAAGILPPETEVGLSAKLEQLERTTGHQAVVVTVPSLNGRSVASVTNDLGNAWGIGRKGYDDGVILLVAPNERRVRIGVGYGLERTLTDALCSEIIERAILPRFREGDLPSGIVAGVDALASHLE